MAMQAGMGLSKIIILFGAGYTGTILLNNGKLSELLNELQGLLKRQSGDSENADSDPIAAQVRRLAQEVRQFASGRQITVLNGSSGGIDVTSLIIPVGALGALGYGYMWWKGLSFSDLIFVSKKNMTVAVTSLKKNLEGVSEAVENTKKYLTKRIENLDGKVDSVKETSNLIENEVRGARDDLSRIGSEFLQLKVTVESLDEKVNSIETKQTLTIVGLDYLCKLADGKRMPSYPNYLREELARRMPLPPMEASLIQGLKDIADNLSSTKMIGDGSGRDLIDNPYNKPRSVIRTSSIKLEMPGIQTTLEPQSSHHLRRSFSNVYVSPVSSSAFATYAK
ncbi:hypothetical protein Droror1_Dr00008228 [Drosera rotundifolia]